MAPFSMTMMTRNPDFKTFRRLISQKR